MCHYTMMAAGTVGVLVLVAATRACCPNLPKTPWAIRTAAGGSVWEAVFVFCPVDPSAATHPDALGLAAFDRDAGAKPPTVGGAFVIGPTSKVRI